MNWFQKLKLTLRVYQEKWFIGNSKSGIILTEFKSDVASQIEIMLLLVAAIIITISSLHLNHNPVVWEKLFHGLSVFECGIDCVSFSKCLFELFMNLFNADCLFEIDEEQNNMRKMLYTPKANPGQSFLKCFRSHKHRSCYFAAKYGLVRTE